MILEEIDGDVKVVLNGKALAVGNDIPDAHYALVSVIGKGKATFRVDPSCTVEVKGIESENATAPAPAPAPAPVVKEPVIEEAAVIETVVDTAEKKV